MPANIRYCFQFLPPPVVWSAVDPVAGDPVFGVDAGAAPAAVPVTASRAPNSMGARLGLLAGLTSVFSHLMDCCCDDFFIMLRHTGQKIESAGIMLWHAGHSTSSDTAIWAPHWLQKCEPSGH